MCGARTINVAKFFQYIHTSIGIKNLIIHVANCNKKRNQENVCYKASFSAVKVSGDCPGNPRGPNSGYLIIQDEESETYSCFGLCKNRTLTELPFPQNKELVVQFIKNTAGGNTYVYVDPVFLIPVLNQPLFSNLYYAIVPHRNHKGEAYTCSREEDKTNCCFCRCISDVKPRELDPHDVYQQFKIIPSEAACSSKGQFLANSIAPEGFPPKFFRRKGWSIHTKAPSDFKLDSAQGLDSELRCRLPKLSSGSSVVGRWYTPFMFVKDGAVKDQVKRSMYYEVTLERRWEKIFSCRRNSNGSQGNSVKMDALVEKEQVIVGGNKAVWNEVDGVVWFRTDGPGAGFGLRVELVERMKWEEERGGWKGAEEEKRVKISRVEEFNGEWSEFGCFVLVERFNLKRMDASLVMSYDFKHLHQMKTKWE